MKKLHCVSAAAILILACGCSMHPVATVAETRVLKDQVPPGQIGVPRGRPAAAVSPRASLLPDGRRYTLSLRDADLVEALGILSRESGVVIMTEPGVGGKVTLHADQLQLGDLLFTLLRPLGYRASVENGAIVVGKPELASQTYYLNYTKDKRSSSSSTNASISAAGGSGGGAISSGINLNLNTGASSTSSGNQGGGSGQGNVNVTTSGTTDFWEEVGRGIETIVFGNDGAGKGNIGGFTRSDDLGRKLVINQMAGVLYVTASPEILSHVSSYLYDVEEAVKRQVLIQAQIVEVSLNNSFSLGIDWSYVFSQSQNFSFSQTLTPSTLASGFNFTLTGADFSMMLDALKTQGDVSMLSSPKISTLNNQRAVIKLTTREVTWVNSTILNAQGDTLQTYTTPQIDEVGIFLDVTPNISGEGVVTMQIHPSISEITRVSESPDGKSSKPVIDVREVDTMVDVPTGQTVVIAGLIVDKSRDDRKSVPLLGELPLIGGLFSYTNQERVKTELVIFLTPYLVTDKTLAEIRTEHEQRLLRMDKNYQLINTLRPEFFAETGSRLSRPAPSPAAPPVAHETSSAAPLPFPATSPSSPGESVPAPVFAAPSPLPSPPQAAATTAPESPGDSDSDFQAGLLAYKQGNCSAAIPAFERYLNRFPLGPQAEEARRYRTVCRNFQ